jgi:hypothetical protein
MYAGHIFSFIPKDLFDLIPATYYPVFLLGMLGLGLSLAGLLYVSGLSDKLVNFAIEKKNSRKKK